MRTSLEHPAKTKLTFRVGIAGHRLHRLKAAHLPTLHAKIREILALIQDEVRQFGQNHHDLFDMATPRNDKKPGPILRVVSSLAEGADRIVAEEAIGLGYELQCPMPFAEAEFEEDFKPRPLTEPDGLRARSPVNGGTVEEFRSLLAKAHAETRLIKFELDGSRQPDRNPYAPAARVVLNQSDVLVVVWDGGDASKPGGTLETLRLAFAFHVPVVWIDARAPHDWQFLKSLRDLDEPQLGSATSGVYHVRATAEDSEKLRGAIRSALEPPATESADHAHTGAKSDLRKAFFSERQRHGNWAVFWKLFRNLIGSNQLTWPTFVDRRTFEEQVAEKWPYAEGDFKLGTRSPEWAIDLNRKLRSHYAWPDKLADYYADGYRSSFLLTFLLGSMAVFLALFCTAAGWIGEQYHNREALFVGGELVVILVILGLIALGNVRRWHERWMDYRLVAELVRQLRVMIPLGGGMPLPRVPAHHGAYGLPAKTWMYWHVRSIERELGLPAIRVDHEFLQQYLASLRTHLVATQIVFHQTTEVRMLRIDHRLHRWGNALFAGTLVACVLHFIPHMLPGEISHSPSFVMAAPWLTLLAAVLPALGASLAAIRNQGEFLRVSKRSRAMRERLNEIDKELMAIECAPEELNSTALLPKATQAIQLMVDEVLDWRVVFLDRPLVPPA